jgi:recombination protein RecR
LASLPKAITDLAGVFERLPGVGPKSATRLVFYLVNAPESFAKNFSQSLLDLKSKIKICQKCFGVSERDICPICADKTRDNQVIWVVERAIEVVALENVGGLKRVYHVLGGLVNPLDHVGPEDIRINELIERLKEMEDKKEIEVVLAVSPTMEGEATSMYIKKKIDSLQKKIKITRIGSGLPIGADLEFADQATLSRSMENRRRL